ncbi:zinc carboxypeptidase-like [Episyrphus balteatus]|uniref:zinc carboxypeptidase-like n=1 Tax=Episyrphus balteatus TaxID=286459 RepID=UPI0024853CAE|nr:zinc carboxypeptidase-like [Episyrphus balteatus]
MKLFILISALAVFGVSWAEQLRYDNHTVYKVLIENENQLTIVKHLSTLPNGYNLWKPFHGVGSDAHIMVSPKMKSAFDSLMKLNDFGTEVLIENVQSLIDEESSSYKRDATFGWTSYHSLDTIYDWIDDIIAEYSNIVTPFVIGKSYEGREIRGIKISSKDGNPGIFIETNVHAREWITSATVTYFINQLLTSDRAELKNMRENIDWYIIPVYNVDGFVYSHEKDRMWRKSRQPVSGSNCMGADINRNFDSHWMENGGALSDPCAETFGGPKPFSEPEAQALADFVTNIQDKINIYLSFHSYGQYLLCPYGHSATELPTNYADLLEIGKAAADAISRPYGTKFTYGSTGSVLYVASGTSVDWMFNERNIKVGWTFEFRDKGRYGFVLPATHIKPNAEEAVEGVIALVEKSSALGYL